MKIETDVYCVSINTIQEKIFTSISDPTIGYYPKQSASLEGLGIEIRMQSSFTDNFKQKDLLSKLMFNPKAKIKLTLEIEEEKIVKKIV